MDCQKVIQPIQLERQIYAFMGNSIFSVVIKNRDIEMREKCVKMEKNWKTKYEESEIEGVRELEK